MNLKKLLVPYLTFTAISVFLMVFVISQTFVSADEPQKIQEVEQLDIKYSVSEIPILKNSDSFPLFTAESVYALDLDSSVVIYQKNPEEQVYPASTTKMITALVAMDYYKLDDVLNTGQFKSVGSNMGLVWNENITFESLLYGLLIHSANDAAEVLAKNYPGGRDAFINQMNVKANELYAKNTVFKNPSGLDELGHKSTAKDLVRIATYAMSNELFSEIVGTTSYMATDTTGNIKHRLTNRNELLGEVEGVLGVKTGFTEGAKENLVTVIERDGRRIVIAVLGSQDRFAETKKLIDWIYQNYEWTETTTQLKVVQ